MATLRRKGRYWYLRARTGGVDTEVGTGCTDKKAAETWLRQWERDRADPERAARDAARETTVQQAVNLTLERYDAEHRADNIAGDTLAYYERKLGVVLTGLGADTPLCDVTAARVDQYISDRRDQGASDHTIHKELYVLEITLKLARRGGLWVGHPDDVLPERFSPRYEPSDRVLSVDDVWKVVDHLNLRGPTGSYRRARPDRAAWVALAAGAGAELAALEGAERDDWDSDTGLVLVRGTKTEHRHREVPVVLSANKELLEFAFSSGEGAGKFLLKPWGKNWRDLQDAAEAVGIEPFSLHSLRHSFATWHLAAGLSFDDVARALGHADTTMLHRVYGHLSGAELRTRFAGILGAETSPDVPRYGAQTVISEPSARTSRKP